jgi:hypothetical protein
MVGICRLSWCKKTQGTSMRMDPRLQGTRVGRRGTERRGCRPGHRPSLNKYSPGIMWRTIDTKQVCQFIGTPSVECCSKTIFPTRVTWGLISNSRGTVKEALFILVRQPAKQVPCLVSPNPPSGCQAQGFKISTTNKIK